MPAGSCGSRALGLLALTGCLQSPGAGNGGDGIAAVDASAFVGQARAWVTRDSDPVPPALFGPRLVYDSRDRRVLAYGGSTTSDPSGATDQFMAWDGTRWSKLCDQCPPGPRLHHGFAYDSARGVAVLYGGVDGAGGRLGDVWEWDGVAWTGLGEAGPPARSHAWTSYDPGRERMVVFGGETDLGPTNELMEYDGVNWFILDSGEISPSARLDAGGNAAAYDPVSGRILVYGDDELGDDLWAWDGSEWKMVCDQCTDQPREGAMLEVDRSRQRVLVVGGYQDGIDVFGTWELSTDGALLCDMREPTGRDNGGLTRDELRDVLVLFGGNGDGCEDNCDQTLEMVIGEGGNCAL